MSLTKNQAKELINRAHQGADNAQSEREFLEAKAFQAGQIVEEKSIRCDLGSTLEIVGVELAGIPLVHLLNTINRTGVDVNQEIKLGKEAVKTLRGVGK